MRGLTYDEAEERVRLLNDPMACGCELTAGGGVTWVGYELWRPPAPIERRQRDHDDRLLLALYFDRASRVPVWSWGVVCWSMQELSVRVNHGLATADLLASLGRLVQSGRLCWDRNFGFMVPEDSGWFMG